MKKKKSSQIKVKEKLKERFVQPSSERAVEKCECAPTRFEQRQGDSRLPDQHGDQPRYTENDCCSLYFGLSFNFRDNTDCLLQVTVYNKFAKKVNKKFLEVSEWMPVGQF